MSLLDRPEFDRWLRQAQNALESATVDRENGYHNWACFKAQQAAEYALKGLLRAAGKVATGHSCFKLARELKDLGVAPTRRIEAYCRVLDRHYIPSRYPDAYPEASPFEYYGDGDAKEALSAARTILDFVTGKMGDA